MAPGTITIGGDLAVERMGFGALHIAGPGSFGPPRDRATALALLQRVVARGVQLIDTADSYGPAWSEGAIAEALHPYPKGLVIATKGGLLRPSAGRWDPDCRPEHLRAACEASLKRLKLERIDLYQLHTVDAKRAARRERRRARRIAEGGQDSPYRPLQRRCAPARARPQGRDDRRGAEPLQSRRSLVRPGGGPVRKGRACLPAVVSAASADERRARIEAIAKRHNATTAQVALAWLMRRSPCVLPIPGTSQGAHFDENFAARDLALSDEEFAAL